jgi:hypothetical protein
MCQEIEKSKPSFTRLLIFVFTQDLNRIQLLTIEHIGSLTLVVAIYRRQSSPKGLAIASHILPVLLGVLAGVRLGRIFDSVRLC